LKPSLFLRFLLVGGLNTAFGYVCFSLLLYAGLHYTMSLLIATVLGVLFNFKTIGALVFKSSDNFLIFRFVLVYVAVYGVNVIGVEAFLRLGLTPYWGGAVMVLPMAVLAFILQKRFVFANG
jgi:putative flippase GtrA